MWEDLRDPLVAFRCVEPAGVPFRKSLAYDDKVDPSIQSGPETGDIVVGEIVVGSSTEESTAAKVSSGGGSTNLLWYRLSVYAPSDGVRVRREPSLDADQVGYVEPGSFIDDVVPVIKVENNWLKLAPKAYATLQGNADFVTHDPDLEGWCILSSPRGSGDPFFEETSHPLGHFDHVSAWLSLTLPLHGPLYLPLSSTSGAPMFHLCKAGSNGSDSQKMAPMLCNKGHAGEWRSDTRRQWCSLAHELEGMECNHGDSIIEAPHWSCCGSFRHDDMVCANASLAVGDAVVRGPDWNSDRQDGGPGGRGTVLKTASEGESKGRVQVKWEAHGHVDSYRMGADGGKRDLIYSPPPLPSAPRCGRGKHPLGKFITPHSSYSCDGCGSRLDTGSSAHGCRICDYLCEKLGW